MIQVDVELSTGWSNEVHRMTHKPWPEFSSKFQGSSNVKRVFTLYK